MNDYIKLKEQLEELRVDILNYSNNEIEPQSLMEQFFKVKEHNPETYELLVLLYNEFYMTQKYNKKQFQTMFDKSFAIKDGTVNKLIRERPYHLKWSSKIYNLFTWKNTVRVFVLWVGILTILTLLYEFEPVVFNKLSDNTFKLVDKIDNVIQPKKD